MAGSTTPQRNPHEQNQRNQDAFESTSPPGEKEDAMLECVLFCSALQVLSLSPGEVDDWDRNEARSAPSHMKNGPDLNDEEEEEDNVAEVERGQERRKVTVRSVPKDNPDVSNWLQTSKTLRQSWSKLG